MNYARYIGDVVGKEFVLDTSALVPMTSAERVAYIVAEGRKLDVLPEALSAQRDRAASRGLYRQLCCHGQLLAASLSRGRPFCAARQSLDLVGAPCLSWGEILRGPPPTAGVPETTTRFWPVPICSPACSSSSTSEWPSGAAVFDVKEKLWNGARVVAGTEAMQTRRRRCKVHLGRGQLKTSSS